MDNVNSFHILSLLKDIITHKNTHVDILEAAYLALGSLGGSPSYFPWELKHLSHIAYRMTHEHRGIDFSSVKWGSGISISSFGPNTSVIRRSSGDCSRPNQFDAIKREKDKTNA